MNKKYKNLFLVITVGLIIYSLTIGYAQEKTEVIYVPKIYLDKKIFGKYGDSVKTEWLEDGRKMRLLETFTYADPNGLEWTAPIGSVIDGASIPEVLWSMFGGPYTGKYRDASVIHDVACDRKKRSWESTHMAFFNAMIASGVDLQTALKFYAAVYFFGPTWQIKHTKEVLWSEVGHFVETVKSESDSGSSIKFTEREIANEPDMVYMTVIVEPPKRRFKIIDLEKLFDRIEKRMNSKEGPMSLEEIRNYTPTE